MGDAVFMAMNGLAVPLTSKRFDIWNVQYHFKTVTWAPKFFLRTLLGLHLLLPLQNHSLLCSDKICPIWVLYQIFSKRGFSATKQKKHTLVVNKHFQWITMWQGFFSIAFTSIWRTQCTLLVSRCIICHSCHLLDFQM